MLLARDRFGQKPLFLFQSPELLLFGSEIKTIISHPTVAAEVDIDAVWDYLAYRYVPGPRTLYKGIRKLRPGTCAAWQRGTLRETIYYRPPDREPRHSVPVPDDPVEAFYEELDAAVRMRMVSDVPFGAFLSGGIDSSAVVGLMARHSTLPVKTFSVGFAESQYSELQYARVIAEQFGTEHRELVVGEDQMMDLLPRLIEFRDAPVSEPSDIPIYLISREARRSVKMVLTGEGSDELLGGYPKHVFEPLARLYQMVPRVLRGSLIEPSIHALPYRYRRAKTAITSLGLEDWEERMIRWLGALSNPERQRLVAFREPDSPSGSDVQFDTPTSNSTLRRILYFDQTSWLPDNLLERGDRMTMAASLEARMPFMDHRLAEFLSRLPDPYRVRGWQTKWILRKAMERLLPKSILERSKVGFRVPVNDWFRGPMRDYLYDHLMGSDSMTRPYYQKESLQRVLLEHIECRQNHEKLLWTLLTLELWHRHCLKAPSAAVVSSRLEIP